MKMTRPAAGASCFTYTLGRSLYLPLTSRCNSCTLPETRGPNFLLPAHSVAALCRLRDAESQSETWANWCRQLETVEDDPQRLPKALEKVERLLETSSDADDEDGRFPTVKSLFDEVSAAIATQEFESIVIAGEGEPTLRLSALLSIAKRCNSSGDFPPIRLTTNGLVMKRNIAKDLLNCGIYSVSVALITHDAAQYDDIMKPMLPSSVGVSAHGTVCNFIKEAVDSGLQVETTGVERTDVDKEKIEQLASTLGVTMPFRWRSFLGT